MDFQLRFLNYFLTIVEERSFSRAAIKLKISQPSLSQRIQTLEAQLGFPLLTRSVRGVTLTSEAQTLLEPFRDLVGRGSRIERLATDFREGETRPIQLGVTMYSGHPERAALLKDFLAAHPATRIHIETIYTVDLYPALVNARYDLGFSVGPPPPHPLDYINLCHLRTELLVPGDSPLARHDEIPISELAGLHIASIRSQRFPALFDMALHPLEEAGAILTYPTDQTPMGLVTYGRTHHAVIAMAIPFMADPELAAAGLLRRPIAGLDPPVALMLVRPREAATHIGMKLWDFARSWTKEAIQAENWPSPRSAGETRPGDPR